MKKAVKKMERPRLVKEVFPREYSIFTHIDYNFIAATKIELDLLFYTTYGERPISPLVSSIMVGPTLSSNDIHILGKLLTTKYAMKWSKLERLNNTQYDPIYNYSDEMTEQLTDTRITNELAHSFDENQNDVTDTINNTKNNDVTRSENSTSSENLDNSSNKSVYSFNSSTPSPTNVTEGADKNSYNGETSITNKEVETNETSKTTAESGHRNSTRDSNIRDDNTLSRTVKHKGNIGNHTTQRLINEEIELRNKFDLVQIFLQDAKDLLTLPIYL